MKYVNIYRYSIGLFYSFSISILSSSYLNCFILVRVAVYSSSTPGTLDTRWTYVHPRCDTCSSQDISFSLYAFSAPFALMLIGNSQPTYQNKHLVIDDVKKKKAIPFSHTVLKAVQVNLMSIISTNHC